MNERDTELYNEFEKYRYLPPDLFRRRINMGEVTNIPAAGEIVSRDIAPPSMGDAIYLSRNLLGQTIAIGTTPTLILQSTYAWPYLLLNPSTSVGLTTSVTGFNGIANDTDTTVSFGVSGFDEIHLTLNVTAVAALATWDIYAQTFDSISATWVRSQAVFIGIGATGGYYAFPGSFGVGTDLRFEFVRTAGAGTLTCSIGVIMKGGTGGSSAGLAQVAYLGGPNVTTTSGFPLLEGQRQAFIVGEGVELWGIAPSAINIRLFQL